MGVAISASYSYSELFSGQFGREVVLYWRFSYFGTLEFVDSEVPISQGSLLKVPPLAMNYFVKV